MADAGEVVDQFVFGGGFLDWLGTSAMGLFTVAAGIVATLMAVAAISRAYKPARHMWAGSLVCALLAVFLGHDLSRSLARFSRIDVHQDGTWVLRNLAGVELMRLGQNDLRAVDFYGQRRRQGPVHSHCVRVETPAGDKRESLCVSVHSEKEPFKPFKTMIANQANPREP